MGVRTDLSTAHGVRGERKPLQMLKRNLRYRLFLCNLLHPSPPSSLPRPTPALAPTGQPALLYRILYSLATPTSRVLSRVFTESLSYCRRSSKSTELIYLRKLDGSIYSPTSFPPHFSPLPIHGGTLTKLGPTHIRQRR